MLVIREDQMRALEGVVSSRFEEEMVKHLAEYAPKLFELRGESCFRQLIRAGMQRAKERYDITNRGPLRLYIELMVALGWDFDTDPQFPWAQWVLNDPEQDDQMTRADQLYREAVAYMNIVLGPQNEYAIAAMRRLGEAYRLIQRLIPSDMETQFLDGMYEFYPERSAYAGEAQLGKLIEEAIQCAERYEMSSAQAGGLVTMLFFSVGHGAATDPLYPWIGDTLTPPEHSKEDVRTERLLAKTRAYFDATLRHFVAISDVDC